MPPIPSPYVLEIRDVDFCYHSSRPVLRGCTHRFAQGALTALIGPNGSGKSTLLRLLLGTLVPSRGSVLLASKEVSGISPQTRAKSIAFIPQRSETIFAFTASEIISMGAAASGRRYESAQFAATLPDLHAPMNELSIGQQQRVLVARSLAQLGSKDSDVTGIDTKVLLADEPTAAMDQRYAIATMQELKSLAKQGVSVIVVAHDLALAEQFADECVLLDSGGKLAVAGKAQDVLTPINISNVFGVTFERAPGLRAVAT